MERHKEKVTDDKVLSETSVDDESNEEKVSFNEDESNSFVKSKLDEELETLPLFSIHEMLKELLNGQNKLMKNQQILNSNLNSLREGLLKVTEKQEEIIKKQHNAALKFQEDVLYKIQKNLIMELIGVADNIQMLIEDKENNSDYDLLEAVKDLGKWVDASLRSNSVKRFIDVDQDNKVYNRKRQELVEKQVTENQEEDNTYRSLHPGYEWTLPYLVINSEVQLQRILDENHSPQMFTFVIRPEEVAKLVYKDKNKIEE